MQVTKVTPIEVDGDLVLWVGQLQQLQILHTSAHVAVLRMLCRHRHAAAVVID